MKTATNSIHLQGIGNVNAKPVGKVAAGDTLVWNGGDTNKVVSVERISPRFVAVSLVTAKGVLVRRMGVDRLVACE